MMVPLFRVHVRMEIALRLFNAHRNEIACCRDC